MFDRQGESIFSMGGLWNDVVEIPWRTDGKTDLSEQNIDTQIWMAAAQRRWNVFLLLSKQGNPDIKFRDSLRGPSTANDLWWSSSTFFQSNKAVLRKCLTMS